MKLSNKNQEKEGLKNICMKIEKEKSLSERDKKEIIEKLDNLQKNLGEEKKGKLKTIKERLQNIEITGPEKDIKVIISDIMAMIFEFLTWM